MSAPLPSGTPGDILQLVRTGRARTRNEVMAATGLSRSTVMQRVGLLLGTGLLVEQPDGGDPTGGRRPAVLAFAEHAGVVLAADLGATHGRLAVCDLRGGALAEREQAIRIADGPEPVLEWVAATFVELLAEAGSNKDQVLAVGIGVPGPVDVALGRPETPPIMPGWDAYPVVEELERRYGVPVLLERDVNAMALGEHRTYWHELAHMVFVKVATGIGAGIISDGVLVRGNHGRAGDIGHIRAITPSDVICTCGNRGCVGALASGSAVVRQLREAGVDVATVHDVVELLKVDDAQAVHHVREAGRVLGAALAALVSVMAPSAIVVGGDMAEVPGPLLAGIRESIYQRSSPLATRELRILSSVLGPRAGVVGITTLALEYILDPAHVGALLKRRGIAA